MVSWKQLFPNPSCFNQDAVILLDHIAELCPIDPLAKAGHCKSEWLHRSLKLGLITKVEYRNLLNQMHGRDPILYQEETPITL